MKKKLSILLTAVMLLTSASSAFAAQPAGVGPNEKATGGVTYNMYNWENRTEFNAQEQFTQCYNDVVGTWVWSFFDIMSGLTYHHDVTITSQSGGSFTGTGGYPNGGPYTDTFVVNGTVNKDQIQYTIVYVTGNVGYTINASGMVNPWGAWGSNWNSNTGQTGFWYSMSGGSTTVGCEGKGMINYRNDNGDYFKADIKYVNVVSPKAYFAGKITKTNQPWMLGQWAVFGIHDGGEPAVGVDQIGFWVTDEGSAKYIVASELMPWGFVVATGNLQIH